jgi:hypothetical protein
MERKSSTGRAGRDFQGGGGDATAAGAFDDMEDVALADAAAATVAAAAAVAAAADTALAAADLKPLGVGVEADALAESALRGVNGSDKGERIEAAALEFAVLDKERPCGVAERGAGAGAGAGAGVGEGSDDMRPVATAAAAAVGDRGVASAATMAAADAEPIG